MDDWHVAKGEQELLSNINNLKEGVTTLKAAVVGNTMVRDQEQALALYLKTGWGCRPAAGTGLGPTGSRR